MLKILLLCAGAGAFAPPPQLRHHRCAPRRNKHHRCAPRRAASQNQAANPETKITSDYVATLFDSSDHAWKSKELISQTARLSLASAPNLGRLTILTHETYRGLSALRDLASPAVHVEALPDHDVGLVTHPNNWVLLKKAKANRPVASASKTLANKTTLATKPYPIFSSPREEEGSATKTATAPSTPATPARAMSAPRGAPASTTSPSRYGTTM